MKRKTQKKLHTINYLVPVVQKTSYLFLLIAQYALTNDSFFNLEIKHVALSS